MMTRSPFPRSSGTDDRDEARDTGLAAVLILLLAAFFAESPRFVLAAIIVQVVCMVRPEVFRPLAGPWMGLSRCLGRIMSAILFTALFFGLVTPVGWVRRILGADPLQARLWKQGDGSVFAVRDHRYGSKDLEHPY